MSDSPDKLETHPTPDIKHFSKKLLMPTVLIVCGIVGLIMFQIANTGNKSQDEEKEQVQEIQINENKIDFAPTTKDTGLLIPPQKEEPEEEIKDEVISEITISRMPEPSENVKRYMQMREQAYLSALNASITAYTGSKNSIEQTNQEQAVVSIPATERPVLPNMAINTGQNAYNVSADIDKEQFFERSRPDNQWINQNIRTAGQKYEIKTGSVIPAAMITAINSDLPGNLIAQVTQNVYDTVTGNYLLIPQGTKLFGVYDSRIIMGQQRVLVAWNRIVFPDGSAMTIPSIPGSDMAGNSGFRQKVDNHYFRIFGSSILMALITAGTAYAVDENTNSDNENSLSSQLNAALAQQLGQVTSSLLEKHLNIKPTLEIEPGYQFNVVLTKDLVFGGAYKGWK